VTGNQVISVAVDLYQVRWVLDDLALFTAEITAEHEQAADTDLARAAVTGIVDDLAAHGSDAAVLH
jgi:hypothetical protein